jgi:hypothetical protein
LNKFQAGEIIQNKKKKVKSGKQTALPIGEKNPANTE